MGYNSHNGFCNLTLICKSLIKMVEDVYNVKLPSINHWFLQRVDIAICYDLKNQENIKSYVNNLSCCNFPKRNIKHYQDESIYLTGSTTTLKIYNKLLEFRKHDISNFKDSNFNLTNYQNTIKGYIRFECEIKKKKLVNTFHKKYIRVTHISYKELKKIWKDEFSKLLKSLDIDLTIINERTAIKNRLHTLYSNIRAKNLFNFYLLITLQGLQEIKRTTNRSMYYKNLADLKKAGIDFSQKLDVNLEDNRIDFNPFESEEIP